MLLSIKLIVKLCPLLIALREKSTHSTNMTPLRGPNKGASWVHEDPYLTIGWEDTSELGVSSLKHSSMRQVLSDQSMLTPDLFANVPWKLALYLWDCMGRSRKKTIYMWKLLATAYPEDFRKISRYTCMHVEGPLMPVHQYLSLLKSDNLHWGVALTLFTPFASTPELVDIANVKNLVALDLTMSETASASNEETATALDNRIMRTWSEMAGDSSSAGETGSAFAHLRVLKIAHQTEVTTTALRYLRAFPSLRHVIICNCPNIIRAFKNNSSRSIEGWHLSNSASAGYHSPVSLPDQLYTEYEKSWEAHSDRTDATSSPSLSRVCPILGFQIGREMRQLSRKTFTTLDLVRQHNPEQQEAQEPPPKRPRQAPSHPGKPPGRSSRSMKERKARDLNSVLNDLL